MVPQVKKALVRAAFAAMVAGLAMPAAGQMGPGGGDGPAPGRGGGRMQRMDVSSRLDRMARRLNLTDDQKAKIRPILEEEVGKVKEVRADTGLTRQELRTKMQAIRQETHDRIQAILTPEQQKIAEQMRTQRRPRRGMRNMPPPPDVAPPQQ